MTRPLTLAAVLGAAWLAAAAPAQDGWTTLQEVPKEPVPATGADGEQTLEFYDVRDLLGDTEEPDAALDGLLAILVDEMRPAYREGVSELKGMNGAVVLRGGPRQQEWLRGFLEVQRRRPELVIIESRTFSIGADAFQGLGLAETTTLLETPEKVRKFQAVLDAARNVDVLMSPRVLCEPRQRASIQAGSEVTYVKDWEIVIVQPGDTPIADPVIDKVLEGTKLDLVAVPVSRSSYLLSVQFRQTELQRPIPTHTARIDGYDQELTFAIPTLETVELSSKLTVPAEGGVVFTAPSRDGKVVGVILTVKATDIDPGVVREPPAKKDAGKDAR